MCRQTRLPWRNRVRATVVKPTYITWMTLAFMTTASVASLRSAPTMAVYGLTCVFLYLVPAIIFLLPQSLVAAELASGWTGGVFRWVSEGLSPRWGLLAVWCQFAMTIFYYPTLLGFVASTLAYVFNPDLADNGVYTGIVIVVVFWLGVFMSARGGTGGIAKLASSGLLIGTLIPGAILVILGIVYLLQGNPSAAPMDADHLIPKWTGIASLVLIVNNFLSYSGMEMNAVHVGSLKNPKKEFPRAMFFACGLVLLIFILPALAISWVIPADQLSLTAGVMQAFDAFFAYFNLQKLVPIVAIALVCASAGGMLTWLAGPSKGLLLIARKEGYLPPFFQHQNENEFPVNILVVQGAITTVIALLYALVPSVSSAYWILSVMTTQVYLIVYLLMFVAAVKLRRTQPNVERGYTAPALKFLCVVGFIASAAAILIGFVPPSQFENGSDGGVHRADPGRHGAARPAAAVAVPEVPQTELEVERARRWRHDRHPRVPPVARRRQHAALVLDHRRRRRRAGDHRPDHLQRQEGRRGGPAEGRAAHAWRSRRRADACRSTRTSSSARSGATAARSATTPPTRSAGRPCSIR